MVLQLPGARRLRAPGSVAPHYRDRAARAMNYQTLDDEKPKRARDWTAQWDQLQPIGSVNGAVREALDDFCARKRITFAALEALDARYAARHRHICLAFAGRNRDGTRVLAIKYRPVD